MAEPNSHSSVARESQDSFEGARRQAGGKETLRRKSRSRDRAGNRRSEHESHLRGGDQQRNYTERNCSLEHRSLGATEGVERAERSSSASEIVLRRSEGQER